MSKLSGAYIKNKQKVAKQKRLYEGKIIDVNGKISKQWPYTYLGITSNGHYYAQKAYEQSPWGKFKTDIVWQKQETIHHEILIHENKIYTFSKETQRYRGRDVDFCTILTYNQQGKLLETWSTWQQLKQIKKHHSALELDLPKLPFLPELARRKEQSPWGGYYDYYRLNSLQIIPKNKLGKIDKRFQQGNWLISFRHGSLIFILDKQTKQIVWKCTPKQLDIQGQHAPQLLEDGTILIFDNGRYRKQSRILIINPENYAILWQYTNKDFFTLSQGYVQKARNGNFLITESEKGHVFEITPEKEIVWEFWHPEIQSKKNSKFPERYGTRQWIYRMTYED